MIFHLMDFLALGDNFVTLPAKQQKLLQVYNITVYDAEPNGYRSARFPRNTRNTKFIYCRQIQPVSKLVSIFNIRRLFDGKILISKEVGFGSFTFSS